MSQLRDPTSPNVLASSMPEALAGALSVNDGPLLLEAIQELSYLRHLEGVTAVVRRWARMLTNADGVTFVLRDGEWCYYADEEAVAPLWKGRRFPIETCISGWAMVHKESVIVPDIYADSRIPVDAYRPTFVKSLAMVPVRQNEPIAAIGAYWATHHKATERELAVLQTLANATSIALANTELLQEVERGRTRFANLVEAVPHLVWTTTADGSVTYANSHWGEFTGWSPADLGRSWTDYLEADDVVSVREHWAKAISARHPFEGEVCMRRRDGAHRWVLIRAALLEGIGQGEEWVSTGTDIEAQKQAEYAEARAVRERDEFLSVASHELRTPLAALHLNLEAIERRAMAAQCVEATRITRTMSQLKRLETLVDELLDFSKLGTGVLQIQRSPVNLAQLVRDLASRNAAAATRVGCDLRLSLDESVSGDWDAMRLEQVLANLLSNAFKYGQGKPVELTVEWRERNAVLRVTDHGIGIDPADVERIFGRFERAVSGRNYSGFGLGLWIARRIIEAHAGRIDVHSAEGSGATFSVRLPAAAE